MEQRLWKLKIISTSFFDNYPFFVQHAIELLKIFQYVNELLGYCIDKGLIFLLVLLLV